MGIRLNEISSIPYKVFQVSLWEVNAHVYYLVKVLRNPPEEVGHAHVHAAYLKKYFT